MYRAGSGSVVGIQLRAGDMMKKQNIDLVQIEALRFIKAAKASRKALPGSKEYGTLRRASMDLTRALANMRRRGA